MFLYIKILEVHIPSFPTPPTPSYARASPRFSIVKYELQQIRLTEAEVDARVSNYARNFLRCIYVWMLAAPSEVFCRTVMLR
jgi:hypothetical protein